MIREQDGGLFTNSIEDWSKLWVDHNPYWAIEPHRTETTTIDWIAPPMTATEIQRQVNDAMRAFGKQKEIETIAGFKIGDRVKAYDPHRVGTVTNLTYEQKIDDEIYIMEVAWDDGMTSKSFLPTNEIFKIKEGEEKMKKETTKNNESFRFNRKHYRVMFNGPATILFVDGLYTAPEKYITKAYNENFDEEKGLALALLKSFGISYLDFKRILATAKKEEKKVEETKNQVKVKKETIKKENIIVSPKGKKKGKPFTFFVGDEVVVRECERYTHTTNANAKMCLNKVLKIQEDKSDWTGTCYVVNGHEFSGSELEPFKK